MKDWPRCSGILLHVTSLPGPYGIGDLGAEAYRFADWLVETGQTLWQVLPLVPVAEGGSPYSSPSTFAGNVLCISPERLVEDGLLTPDDLEDTPAFPADAVDFARVIPFKQALLARAFERYEDGAAPHLQEPFEAFRTAQAGWLEDYALFMALKEAHDGRLWTTWDPALVAREPAALAEARRTHARAIHRHRLWQFLFARQWQALKTYCNERGLRIFGDLPIYVAHDSADVWSNPSLFHLDEAGNPTVVAGVPPDYFSETGQRWGNPIYRWDVMRENGYAWWIERLRAVLTQVDLVRLDHFRGFEAYWEIPASEPTAVNGRWVKGPGDDFFETVRRTLGALPIVAEDLGIITDEVRALMARFDLPGMAVLQFAFGSGEDSSFLPPNFKEHLVAYTGTHDNDTVLGWWAHLEEVIGAEAAQRTREHVRHYFDLRPGDERELHWRFIEALWTSRARTVVTPMQDVLGLGSEGRMNTPGTDAGNWRWRYEPARLTDAMTERLRRLTADAGR
ncbi:MAG: 4-alpha-glucanotransferase [Bacteroidetes bacterium]|nr:MAG: 4-alpha-glucanotransferase [Bacteroidota bacterium]